MLVNIIAVPIIRLYMLLLPKQERERKLSVPPLIDDITAFTNTVFEPLLLLILAFIFHGTTRTWLLISAPALAVYANFKETAKLNKMLDFMDTVIEAKDMMNVKDSPGKDNAKGRIIKQAAETIKTNPALVPKVAPLYPDLMDIIDGMNSEGSHLA
jgi:hypothetical protein